MLNYSSWIEIDLNQFKKNLFLIRAYIIDTLFCLAVKANAYGHGLVEISKVAQDQNINYLAVANLLEAIKLRNANITLPILVLGTFHENQISDLIDYDLEIAISSFFKAKLVGRYCQKHNKKCKVHLKIDTGLKRIGVRPETGIELYNYLINEECFILKGIFSHFACSEEENHPMNDVQVTLFGDFIKKIKPNKSILCHLTNSGGLCNIGNKFQDMVRLAALPFGAYTKKMPDELSEIKSIFTLKSKVSFFKVIQKDEGIGYGHTYVTKNISRIVTIPIGYGDGYSRSLSNKAQVLIRGKRYPIVGTISMDQLMVNVNNDRILIGDEVALIGKQENDEIKIKEIAGLSGTISYEVLCSFNERLPRVYIN